AAASSRGISLPESAFAALAGHPKFIELLASIAGEVPLKDLLGEGASASEIGEFALQHIVAALDDGEKALLRVAGIFRDAFSSDVLRTVANAVGSADAFDESTSDLVRRSI